MTADVDLNGHLNGHFALDEDDWLALFSLDTTSEPDTDAITGPAAELYPVLDWHAVWSDTPDACDWLVEPLFERGRIYAVYAPAKAGKSLLLQEIAAGLATGRSVLGNHPTDPMPVLYVDLENSVADIVERMAAYGYGPDDLANLKYLSFPSLPALDSKLGGQHLRAVATHHQAAVVIIDTVSRVIEGKESDSDTFHSLYRHALGPLKALGITTIRLDHEGKDATKGQRGSSAKATDADAVWRLEERSQTSRMLTRTAARTTHHPERMGLSVHFEPFRHVPVDVAEVAPPPVVGVIEAVALLAKLEVPGDWGRDRVRARLAEAGFKVNNNTLASALKVHKDRLEVPG